MEYSTEFKNVKREAKLFYESFADKQPTYHNKSLQKELLSTLNQITGHSEFSDYDIYITKCALVFYVMGFFSKIQDPLHSSLDIAGEIMNLLGADGADIQSIRNCLLAHENPEHSLAPAEQLFSDTVTYYYGADNFMDVIYAISSEEHGNKPAAEILSKDDFSDWMVHLSNHQYYTELAITLRNEGKAKNLKKISAAIRRLEMAPPEIDKSHQHVISDRKILSKDYKNLKGIDTMFKISSTNHQRLSTMADNKAHIMITVNSIILSAIITILLRKITENEFLIFPTIVILIVSLSTMIFAILSTRPSLPNGHHSRTDIDNRQLNLLFFGNFYKMSLEDYSYGMEKMMGDSDYLYRSLTKDIYMQGIVLSKKYKYLRISYNIFMYGLIFSVLAFSIAALIYLF